MPGAGIVPGAAQPERQEQSLSDTASDPGRVVATEPSGPPPVAASEPYTLGHLLGYFLYLGAAGFGGPIALVGAMRRDLVERRRWVAPEDHAEGLALAQLAPGPLAAQLAIYLGWLRSGVLGATLVSFAFILPSFLMVLVLSALYLRFGGLSWMQAAFYGVGAAVVAVIARSAWKLVRATAGKDRLLAAILAVNAAVTAWTESELVWVILASGVLALLVKAPPRWRRPAALAFAPLPAWLVTGLAGPASAATLGAVFLYFAEAGAFVFGSGLAIVPFLHGGVVNRFHWLDERQFLDAVAVAMITPGPVVITVAFIGYLVAGPLGAVVAALGVFLPCYLFVIIAAPHFRRIAANRRVKAFVDGVTAAATGAIAGAAVVLGRRAVVDVPTALIALAALATLVWVKRVPEPLLILAAGLIGLLIHP
jgi:chromate transporter